MSERKDDVLAKYPSRPGRRDDRWMDMDFEELRRMRREGYTVVQIAEEMDVPQRFVTKACKELNIGASSANNGARSGGIKGEQWVQNAITGTRALLIALRKHHPERCVMRDSNGNPLIV